MRCLLTLIALLGLSAVTSATAAPRVVASILPVHSLVASVMQGVGVPHLLLRGRQSPHAFALRPSDARALRDADVVFWIGPALERPLARMLGDGEHARPVALLESPGLTRLQARDPAADHDEQENPASETLPDPHIWLSPANAIAMTDRIAAVLGEVDPVNATLYRTNAARSRALLQTLDAQLRDRLAGLQQPYAVFHDAYQYLEQRYGLHRVATVTTHPEHRPGAQHLIQLRAALASEQVRCLFSEPQFDMRLIDRLGEGLDIRHAVLDPLGSDIPPGPSAYPTLMRQLADGFVRCLEGGPQ
ncbi:MAG: zinc ABC transporter substrate-binding protein [Gammaproteobacteria bacterium]|nr:zinc ABC transporter substrate-binding protein [Gammaproteobacteria bacterium]